MVRFPLAKGADPNCERVTKDGEKISAIRECIFNIPNEYIVYEVASRLSRKPDDVPESLSKKRFNDPKTVKALKAIGIRFPMFGGE